MAKAPDRRSPSDEVPNIGLYLSGDFGSPLDLLAEDTLSDEQKREVLITWRNEIDRNAPPGKIEEVRAYIDEALAALDAE